ncbi:MAG: TolC family protein [Gammaproteobacteria bacterium]|nr:TolC family protein [Gammaproteobacteria bacterium]
MQSWKKSSGLFQHAGRNCVGLIHTGIFLFYFSGPAFADGSGAMTLSEAEMMALRNDTAAKKARAQQESFTQQSVAANTWPDPKLDFGIANISANTLDFQKEPMTQAVIGLTQAFPPWGAVGAKSRQMQSMADAMSHEARNNRLMTLIGVRKSWLDVYLEFQSIQLIKESLEVFGQFINVTQFQYRVGRGNQQDVIRAQLEQNLLEDQLRNTESQHDSAMATLARWLGTEQISQQLDMQFPAFSKLPPEQEILSNLENHPSVMVRKMRVTAAENGVNYASSQRRPGWALRVQYGYRAEDNFGQPRDDMLSALVSIDLPLFTNNRQDRMIAAGTSDVMASKQDLDEWRREIRLRYEKNAAVYNRFNERVKLYQGSVLPNAKQNSEASLNAYKSGVTDFDMLVRARLTELKSQLQYLKLNVERAKAQVELLYLTGID